MELNENASIDTSQIDDQRGSGGGGGGIGGLPIGGGGLTGIIVTVLLALVGGYFGINTLSGDDGGQPQAGDNTTLQQECSQPDALQQLDCRNTLYVNSIQAYWQDELPASFGEQYKPAKTVFFSRAVRTGCGAADSGTGPFYCPADDRVYLDLTFYRLLADQLGAPGEFAQPYVLAHEYGHHVQDLQGILGRAQQDPTGAQGAGVRTELQADCYAGVWAHYAAITKQASTGVPYLEPLSDNDIADALSAASSVGDDRIQKQATGRINPEQWTHGSSAERQKWFTIGYQTGDPNKCDTFATNNLG
jgi:uncharacterized protein